MTNNLKPETRSAKRPARNSEPGTRNPKLGAAWQKGASFGSAGRLGAHAEGFEPGENGYLTYQNAGPVFMQIQPDRHVIGSLQLPPRYTVEEKTLSWTLRVAHYRAAAQDGCPALDLRVLGSVLSPAITFASESDRVFRWRWQVGGSPQWCAFPTRPSASPGPRAAANGPGVSLAHYSRGYPLRPFNAEAAYLFEPGPRREPAPPDLRWNAPWLVTFNLGGRLGVATPLLWVFHGPRPSRIVVTDYEYLDFHFARPFGRISAMPLYGSAEIDRDELAGLCRDEGLDALRDFGDYWAHVLPRLPDEIDDCFRIDEAGGTIEVRNTGRRLDGKRPRVCPVPPFLAAVCAAPQSKAGPAGRPTGMSAPPLGTSAPQPGAVAYPIRIRNRAYPAPRELCTHYGPYQVVEGGELRYTMPLCPYLDTVLSPVRVTGDRRAAALTRRLADYFRDPKHTYGGDGTYDPDSLLDILHNLRVLAWAGWALPDAERPAAHAAIVRGLDRLFTKSSYRYYREPTTGRTFARDPKIFDWCGDITYDMDWYSGMNLAGLFAAVYFGAVTAEFVRKRWGLVRDIAAYFEIFQDWATMVPWTDMRGELLNIDCARHGAQGMIGFARLADRLGKRRERDLARYIASRYMVFWAAEHALPDLYARGRVAVGRWGRNTGRMVLGFGGLYERDLAPHQIGSGAKNPYTLSPLNPEHMLFLRDYGPVEKLEQYESSLLDEEVPGWDTRPAKVYFGMRPPNNIEHNSGAYHFYMVDPHLFLRMLVLDWPSRRAIGHVKELSGQVMAAALVADAPKVLCPASVIFKGTEWDARRRVLTIRARAPRARAPRVHAPCAPVPRPTRATWHILWPEEPAEITGPAGSCVARASRPCPDPHSGHGLEGRATYAFDKGRLTLAADCRGEVEWVLRYR